MSLENTEKFDVTQNWSKVWRETGFFFQKLHKEFSKFSPEHLKVSKLGLWWHLFIQIWKFVSLKFTGELCIMTRKLMQKMVRNWLGSSKLTWGIWGILTREIENPKALHFNGMILTKVYNFWTKREQRSYVS